jgi:hypothetical protein
MHLYVEASAFSKKRRDAVGLYVARRGMWRLCCTKRRVRSRRRIGHGHVFRSRKGRVGIMTHDCRRHWTTTQFAALNVPTVGIHHECTDRHRHQEFVHFARRVWP